MGVALGAIATGAPGAQAQYGTPLWREQDYNRCIRKLTEAGPNLDPVFIANSCAYVLVPADLGDCTHQITRHWGEDPQRVIEACRQVRRPIELGDCTVLVAARNSDLNWKDSLARCERSLLPRRFASCVVAVNDRLNLPTSQASEICLDGRDRPRDLYPAYPEGWR